MRWQPFRQTVRRQWIAWTTRLKFRGRWEAVPPTPEESGIVVADARRFVQLVPATYCEAKDRYPFLPTRSVQLDMQWHGFTPMARAAFLLDYVARLYALVQPHPGLTDRPRLVFRTTDHPNAAVAHREPDSRTYAVQFDLDSGQVLDLHFGHESFVGLAMLLTGWTPYLQRANVYKPRAERTQ